MVILFEITTPLFFQDFELTLYQPMTHICVMSSHKPIRIYMGGLILGVNTLYRLFCYLSCFLWSVKG